MAITTTTTTTTTAHSPQPEAGPSMPRAPRAPRHTAEDGWDGVARYGAQPSTLLASTAAVPSCLDRTSPFFHALTAPTDVPIPTRRRLPPGTAHEARCRAMVRFTALPGGDGPAAHGTDGPAVPPPLLLYRPHGRWAWTAGLPIDAPRTLLALGEGLMCSASIDAGFIAGREVKYISRRWNTNKEEDWIGFYSELALYKSEKHLRPLQGDVVPQLIGVHVMPEAVSLTMELPHSSFWIEASPTMPDVLKERVIAAFEKIHARGVLHGDPELRHMLIGADGRVTIIDFGMSRAVAPDDAVDLEHACREEFLLEMREVKYKLDYRGARTREAAKVRAYLDRLRRNERRRRAWRRRRSGERTGYISPEEDEPADERLEPPVHHRDFEAGWKKGADATPRRVVVPGQTEQDVAAHVHAFVGVLARMGPRPPGDAATLAAAFDAAYERVTGRKPEQDAQPLPQPSSPPPPCPAKRARVAFGGQSHRHIDAQTGRVVRCAGGGGGAHSRCPGPLSRGSSAPEGSGQAARGRGAATPVPRGILKRRRADEAPTEPGDAAAAAVDHRVRKRARASGARTHPRRSRRRAGAVVDLAPDPLGFVLPAWRMFSTLVTFLIPWRR